MVLLNNSWRTVGLLVILPIAACQSQPIPMSDQPDGWPRRVLITNDDGIESPATLRLASAFSGLAETYLIAPAGNQSSGTNFSEAARSGRFLVERRDMGPGIMAWAVDGFPADCVLFALAGPMHDSLPDLVISGVNTGANLADAWVLSGTIGAARIAAYYGVPAIAVSGVDNDDPQAVDAVAAWVVKFARSKVVRHLRPPQFLTVSLPVGPVYGIQGIEVTERGRGLRSMMASQMPEAGEAPGREVWSFEVVRDAFPPSPDTDASVVGEGSIAVVAMRVDESDPDLYQWLMRNKELIPVW
jgi:5'-nucleotidase